MKGTPHASGSSRSAGTLIRINPLIEIPTLCKLNYSVDNQSVAAISNQMVERLDTTFHALSDPTRRAMLARLTLGERSIGELAEPFAMSFAGASKHVKVLEQSGLVVRRKAGRQQLCQLRPEPLAEAEAWLRQWERFWTSSLDRLETLIAAEKEETP